MMTTLVSSVRNPTEARKFLRDAGGRFDTPGLDAVRPKTPALTKSWRRISIVVVCRIAPNPDRANRRSAAPDDRGEPRHRDQRIKELALTVLPPSHHTLLPLMPSPPTQLEFCNTIEGRTD